MEQPLNNFALRNYANRRPIAKSEHVINFRDSLIPLQVPPKFRFPKYELTTGSDRCRRQYHITLHCILRGVLSLNKASTI